MVKLTQVKSCYLLYLFKSVDQSVAVNKQLSRSLRNIEVIFKETLNCEQGFLVEAFNRAALENFL